MLDYKLLPTKKLKNYGELVNKNNKPVISIITAYYNASKTIDETAKSLLNQTYPYFEWIIVDDGSTEKNTSAKLSDLEKKDKRIKVFHKKNEGPSVARDFAISKTSNSTKYCYILDADDLLENNALEVFYWALETHPECSFAYSAIVNFGPREFIYEKYLTVKTEKKDNIICGSNMIRKSDLLEVGCYGIKEKGMYEDWNLWLKLIAAGKKPLRVNARLFWYRTSDSGELSKAKENHKNAMSYVSESAKKITKNIDVVQFPSANTRIFKHNSFNPKKWENMVLPQYKNDKQNILLIVPWLVIGGADIFNLELIKRLDKEKYNVILISMFPNENPLKQEFYHACNELYDLSTFLEREDYITFIDYIIKSRHISNVLCTNSSYGYAMLPYLKSRNPEVSFVDYIHSVDKKDPVGGFGRNSIDTESVLDKTYTCNDFTKKQLISDFHKKNVETIYIGTNEEKFNPKLFNVGDIKEKYKIDPNKIIISFVARLSEEKRPELFVETANKLLQERDDLYFVIAGDGPCMPDVKEKIKKYKLEKHFKLTGMLDNTAEIFAISDLTVNCSNLEGLALSSYESLSMGVPIASSDVGGQSELINDKVGVIVPYEQHFTLEENVNNYANACNKIVNNLDKYKSNCRNRILEGFTLDLMVKKFENEFETLKANENQIPEDIALAYYKSFIEKTYDEYAWLCREYMEEHYGPVCSSNNGKRSIKNILWRIPLWRKFVSSNTWKKLKKVIKRA